MTKAKTKERADDGSLFTTKQAPQAEVIPPTAPAAKKNQLATQPKAQPPARVVLMNDVAKIWEVIERLAGNKDVDAEKLDKLLAVQERLLTRNAQTAFDQAMVEMQPKLPIITRDGRIVVKEKDQAGRRTGDVTQNTPYAKWEKMMPLLKPILHQHGFALTHRSSTAPDGRLRVTAILKGHGHTDDSCYFDLQADTSGSKNNAQAWASSLSYAKRHTACAVLNVVTKDEDDDGKSSGPPVVVGTPLNEEQVTQLIELCEAVECPKERLIEHMNSQAVRPKGHPDITGIATIPASRFDEAIAALRSYESNKKEREASRAKPGAGK